MKTYTNLAVVYDDSTHMTSEAFPNEQHAFLDDESTLLKGLKVKVKVKEVSEHKPPDAISEQRRLSTDKHYDSTQPESMYKKGFGTILVGRTLTSSRFGSKSFNRSGCHVN